MLLVTLLLGSIALVVLFVLFMFLRVRSQAKFFKDNNIPYIGEGGWTFFQMLFGKSTIHQLELDIYKVAKAHDSKFCGIVDVFSGKPGIYITDVELMRHIYIKDFDHFVNRRKFTTQNTNKYLGKMLFAIESDQWKGVRAKLSPSFTTGKIRRMFSIFSKSSENMSKFINREIAATGNDFDLATAFPKYAMDVIASCAFGIDSKCFDVRSGEVSIFEDMGKRFQFNFKPSQFLKFIVMFLAPKVADALKFEAMDPVPQTYFANVIKDVMKKRRESGQRYDDFLQLMMDAQAGLLKEDDEDFNEVLHGTREGINKNTFEKTKGKVTFDDEDIVANCLLFMLGGFDTTQSLLLFTVYALALNDNVQKKLYEEVKGKMEANGGKLTYEGVNEMKYLDLVLNETLRAYPPAPRIERACNKDYELPGTNFVITKGTIVGMPVLPVHRDERHFPEPEKFMPERFLDESKANIRAFQPFGHGPRNCIGMRFALTEVKAVIGQMVIDFKLEPCEKTLIPMEFDSNSNLKPKNGMWLKVTPRMK